MRIDKQLDQTDSVSTDRNDLIVLTRGKPPRGDKPLGVFTKPSLTRNKNTHCQRTDKFRGSDEAFPLRRRERRARWGNAVAYRISHRDSSMEGKVAAKA